MASQERTEGRWGEIRGGLRQRWAALGDDELEQARGDFERLVGVIERRTGEARENIEGYLNDLLHEGREAWQEAERRSRHLRLAPRRAAIRGRETIREAPGASMLSLFASGVIAGVALGLVFSSDR